LITKELKERRQGKMVSERIMDRTFIIWVKKKNSDLLIKLILQ
jgi:hypothetical protein